MSHKKSGCELHMGHPILVSEKNLEFTLAQSGREKVSLVLIVVVIVFWGGDCASCFNTCCIVPGWRPPTTAISSRSRRREEFYPTVFCDTFIGILCILSSFIIFIQLKEESVKILSCLKEKPGRILYWEYCRLVKSSSNESSCRRMSWDFLCQEVGQIENWQRGSLIIWELAARQLFVCCRTSN